MKLDIQITKSGRLIKLWQLLLAIAVLGVGLALFPLRIGLPILFIFEGILIVVLLVVLVGRCSGN